MIITLGESDAFLHDGTARIIIIHVTLDNGKKMQFPYPADLPISDIYKAVSQISDEQIVVPTVIPRAVMQEPAVGMPPPSAPVLSDGEIGREDLVKCVKVEDRGKGATVDIVVGGIYRVIKVNKTQNFVTSYDVIDDNADTQRRIFVLPHEVVFHQKRKPPIPKVVGRVEEIFNCPVEGCGVQFVAYKDPDGKFRGECPKCQTTSEFEGVRNGQPVNPTAQNIQPSTT